MKRLWREKTQYSVARLNTGKRACMYNEIFETRNEENKDLNLYRASLPPPPTHEIIQNLIHLIRLLTLM
jgi:hypothetical protein